MDYISNLLKTEPTALIGIVTAALGLAVSYGLVSQIRADAWILVIPALLPLLQAVLTRQTVFAPATVQKIADAATQLPAGTPVDIGQPPNTDASPPLPGGQG